MVVIISFNISLWVRRDQTIFNHNPINQQTYKLYQRVEPIVLGSSAGQKFDAVKQSKLTFKMSVKIECKTYFRVTIMDQIK